MNAYLPPSLEEICAQALRLPSSPVLLPRILEVIGNDDASMEELTAVIRLDPALASATLRLANSAWFGAGQAPAEDLEQAVQRMGQREVYRLAALALTARWGNQAAEGYGWGPGDFCRFALITALGAEAMARHSGSVEPAAAYTAGLVQDLGKLAVAHSCAPWMPEVRRRQSERGEPWLAAEQAVLGTTHAQVSAELLRRWNFPVRLIACARHNPPGRATPPEVMPLAVHVHAGRFFAATLGSGSGDNALMFALDGALLVDWGFTAEMLTARLPEVFDQASRLLQERLVFGQLAF
jgi:HD-like signal output (HDOD) protein